MDAASCKTEQMKCFIPDDNKLDIIDYRVNK